LKRAAEKNQQKYENKLTQHNEIQVNDKLF